MRHNHSNYKQWQKKRSLKKWSKELYRKSKRKLKRLIGQKTSPKNYSESKTEIFVLPTKLSIFDNFDEVTKSFNHIKNVIESKSFNKNEVFFDISNSTFVSVDALMYLLVFIKNIRKMNSRIVSVRGNFPIDTKMKEVVRKSGFLNYLNSMVGSSYSKENIQIKAGSDVDTSIFVDVLSFIHEKLNCDRNSTKELYTIFGEIIGNANEHAYSIESFNGWNKYLLFSSYNNNKVRIVILDTGEGIIKTIRRKFFERVFPNDSELLRSAMNGEFRTSTGLQYRGNGLPTIREKCQNRIVKNFMLITNNVIYSANVNQTGKFEEEYQSHLSHLNGTLYYFDFYVGGNDR